mgnify:CR=1 FL=1|tara:strand:+ start:2084 stop:3013 length:930 start_codon:yes stop_codon:yes gene_type:complete
MATTTSITTTYAGEFAGKYISAALLSANTIERGGIEVKPNIKFKEVIKKLATGALIANGGCDFAPTSSVTLTERIIEPETFQVNLELCKADFRSDWEAVSMGYSAFDSLPKTFQDYLLAHVVAKVAEKNEQNIWRGVTGNAGEYDGLVTLATADATVIDVAAVGGGINAANVIAQLGAIVDAIPSQLYGKEDLYLYVSQNIARAYVRALGGFAATIGGAGTMNEGTQWYNGGELSFDGVKIFVANGLADNTAMAAEKSNLYFGTGLLSDHNEVKVIDMGDIDGSQNVRIVMRFTAAVQYGIGADIVLYS